VGQAGEGLGGGLADGRLRGGQGGQQFAGKPAVAAQAQGTGEGEKDFGGGGLAQPLADGGGGLGPAGPDQEQGGLALVARVGAAVEHLAQAGDVLGGDGHGVGKR